HDALPILGDHTAWHRQSRRADVGTGHDAQVHASDDPSERVPYEMDTRAVDVAGRVCVEIHPGERACERDEIGRGFAEIVTLGEQAREIDVTRAGRIDLSVRARCTGRVVDDIEIERALDGA